MKFDIIVNKYILMWHLLFGRSINTEIHKEKQRIWNEKKNEYIKLQKEKDIILKDIENYIPDDDDVFDDLENTESYRKIKQETNRYRLTLLEAIDKNKKIYLRELNKILRYNFKSSYTICAIHPSLDVVEIDFDKNNIITIGKKFTPKESDDLLTYLIYKIVKNDLLNIKSDEKIIINTIVELVATNELYTRITKQSKYNLGKKELKEVKHLIYPYWLMYLGIKPNDLEKYMVRDNIFFNKNAYKYEENLKNLDILSFIKFITKNKQRIFTVPKKEIEEAIEEL